MKSTALRLTVSKFSSLIKDSDYSFHFGIKISGPSVQGTNCKYSEQAHLSSALMFIFSTNPTCRYECKCGLDVLYL